MFTVAPVYFDSLSIFYLLSSKHGLSILGIKSKRRPLLGEGGIRWVRKHFAFGQRWTIQVQGDGWCRKTRVSNLVVSQRVLNKGCLVF